MADEKYRRFDEEDVLFLKNVYFHSLKKIGPSVETERPFSIA